MLSSLRRPPVWLTALLAVLWSAADAMSVEKERYLRSHPRFFRHASIHGTAAAPGRFKLFGPRGLDRTVPLNDGNAEDVISLALKLRDGETIHNRSHLTDKPKVLTDLAEHVEIHKLTKGTLANITLTHSFEGLVGVAQFTYTVTTSKGRVFRAQGTYYVTGFVATVPGSSTSSGGVRGRSGGSNSDSGNNGNNGANKGKEGGNSAGDILSGANSNGLQFDSPADVLNRHPDGMVPVTIAYQPPGPDVTSAPTLAQLLTSAEVVVKDRVAHRTPTLIKTDAQACKHLTNATKQSNGRYKFANDACGVGIDRATNELVLRLERGEGGTAIVELQTPGLEVGGEEFETTIRVSVKREAAPTPVVLVAKPVQVTLDFYGDEIFTVDMDYTRRPEARVNATHYFAALAGGRYAAADLNLSRLDGAVQHVTFKTVRPGKGDAAVETAVQKALRAAGLQTPSGGRMHSPEPMVSMEPEAIGSPEPKPSVQEFVFHQALSSQRGRETTSRGVVAVDAVERSSRAWSPEPEPSSMGATAAFEMQFLVLLPPGSDLVVARNTYSNAMETGFAGPELARVATYTGPKKTTCVAVELVTRDYARGNFSEHKSGQLGGYIAGVVGLETGKSSTTEADLIGIRERAKADMVVTYRVDATERAEEVAEALTQNRTHVGLATAENSLLAGWRIEVFDARVLPGTEDPKYAGIGLMKTNLSGAGTGIIAAAAIVLGLVVAIPVFALLFGCAAGRREAEESDDDDSPRGDGGRERGGLDSPSAVGEGERL